MIQKGSLYNTPFGAEENSDSEQGMSNTTIWKNIRPMEDA